MKEELFIPENCNVSLENELVVVSGSKGEVKKRLFNPLVKMFVDKEKIILESKKDNKQAKKLIKTFRAHIKNLFKGANEGHVYKLKICSGHFPMTVVVKENIFEIKNFLGEKVPRTVGILKDTSVKIEGIEIIVESINKEQAGQMAALLEQLTKRPGFDKRIFQDGIYLIEKDGKQIK
ncbi:50S ribosomal protein L6 [Candidatus Woesearchaeota archaeon]|jgi:large subunit ribosomal protein L6|nr:50S ribosomal protein L6 [Candidatus Woesearchaeota archaeon]|tara:strand:+ start:1220 stop:1753 length:534 start_codon:yes stop_codon:yes gene_type:complete